MLVTMPATSHYAENVNTEKLAKIFEECSKLEGLHRNVHYLNLFVDSRFNNSDFYDCDHLNTLGAEKCSKIINTEILRFN